MSSSSDAVYIASLINNETVSVDVSVSAVPVRAMFARLATVKAGTSVALLFMTQPPLSPGT